MDNTVTVCNLQCMRQQHVFNTDDIDSSVSHKSFLIDVRTDDTNIHPVPELGKKPPPETNRFT